MKQITLQKRKIIRNNGKRAKIGSHGFKVYKNTYVYIAKASMGGLCRDGKPAPKVEVVQALQNHFNSSPSIRKMVKHIKGISIKYSDNSKFAGYWVSEKQQFEYIDSNHMNVDDAIQVMIHEVDGHAFWHWAMQWRREELISFNKLANNMSPVNNYVGDNEEEWRKGNDDWDKVDKFEAKWKDLNDYSSEEDAEQYNKEQKEINEYRASEEHKSFTRYANEQHSAVTELMIHGSSYNKQLIGESDLEKLKEAWKRLHY